LAFLDLDHILMQYTVLHPSYKLEYFKNADWSDDWIEDAADTIKEQYTSVYADLDIEDLASSQAVVVSHSDLMLIYFCANFFIGF